MNLTAADKLETIKQDIEIIKQYIVLKLSDQLNQETEEDFRKDFNLFIERIENYFLDVFGDKDAEHNLLSELPQIKPYWNLIKEIHRYDKILFGAVTENQITTENQVAEIIKAKGTLQFIKNSKVKPSKFSLPGEDKLITESSANVKILRIAQFLSYVLAGHASKIVSEEKFNNPNISDSDLNKKIYTSFKQNIYHLKVNNKTVKWYDINSVGKSQPSRNITDGVSFEKLPDGNIRCYMVFASANSNLASQRKQLFKYLEWFKQNKDIAELENNIDLSKVIEVIPVVVCYPLITLDNNINPFKAMFKSDAHFNDKEVALFNSIPMLSQLGNMDNSNSMEFINNIIDSIYFTTGGDTLELQNQFHQLNLIDPPEREKMFLKIYAKTIVAISNVFFEKTNNEKATYISRKNISEETLSAFAGITAMINAVVKHSATFKDDEMFLSEMVKCLGNSFDYFKLFLKKINRSDSSDERVLDGFSNSLLIINPLNFENLVKTTDIAVSQIEQQDIDYKTIMEIVNKYIEILILPSYKESYTRGKKTDFSGHFERIVSHKIENGESSIFTVAEGFDIKTYQFINKFTKPLSIDCDSENQELNIMVTKLFNIIDTNHTTEDIGVSISQEICRILKDKNTELAEELNQLNKLKHNRL